ncbi:uncharacterized protein B0H18DRAFT_954994 [Fomitopsis serialis]|uniref:uncharacterized protein n=1 Tax=Fomitopsis serialis TaxID=139415 RepID=UPI0020077C71|nr:uncharacterized protein B0H18DRAFT_954994 [Neoantrodia serialis]KAH9925804.1 hypothetical protein B0H18DRAFT_954994 [Neoantrodia serialis]
MSTLFQRATGMDVLQTLTPAQTQEQYIENCCAAAAAALLLYDYVVTIGQESRYIWTDIHAGYAAIFLINRLNMLGMAISEIPVFPGHCKQIVAFWGAAALSTMLMWACVSTLRVYAVSNRSILPAAITAVLAAVPIAVNIVSFDSGLCIHQNEFLPGKLCLGPSGKSLPGNYNEQTKILHNT